jgi:hypothetical protein
LHRIVGDGLHPLMIAQRRAAAPSFSANSSRGAAVSSRTMARDFLAHDGADFLAHDFLAHDGANLIEVFLGHWADACPQCRATPSEPVCAIMTLALLPLSGIPMFLSIKEMELRKIRFDETYAPGELDLQLDEIWQAGPLHAQGTAELLANTEGEVRIQGRFEVQHGGGMRSLPGPRAISAGHGFRSLLSACVFHRARRRGGDR